MKWVGRCEWNAVGDVTLNRGHRALQVKHDGTVCDIVYTCARPGHHHCQFSWACHRNAGAKLEEGDAAMILESCAGLGFFMASSLATQSVGRVRGGNRGQLLDQEPVPVGVERPAVGGEPPERL